MKQYTISEFAKKIRVQYPGSYDDISDKKLIELWLKKYPKDKEHIIEESNSGNSWFFYLIVIALIAGGLYLYNNHNISSANRDELSNTITGSEQQTSTVNQYENRSSENANPEQVFPITSDAEELFIDNAIFKIIKIDNDTKNSLLQILSDPNPDPDKIENQSCDNTNTRCIYCNNKVPGVNYSYQNYLYKVLICGPNTLALCDYCVCARMAISSGDIEKSSEQNNESKGYDENDWAKIDWAKVMSSQYKEKVFELEPTIAKMCSNYKNGEKYICIENPVTSGGKNFCSEKCKTEYQYSR
jgi:hypothetical protein